MRRLEDADQPLDGRRTARLTIAPFTYRDIARFVPDYEVCDQLRAYAIFGLPGNLILLDPAEVLEATWGDSFSSRAAVWSTMLGHVLDAFLGEADIHHSISKPSPGANERGVESRAASAKQAHRFRARFKDSEWRLALVYLLGALTKMAPNSAFEEKALDRLLSLSEEPDGVLFKALELDFDTVGEAEPTEEQYLEFCRVHPHDHRLR